MEILLRISGAPLSSLRTLIRMGFDKYEAVVALIAAGRYVMRRLVEKDFEGLRAKGGGLPLPGSDKLSTNQELRFSQLVAGAPPGGPCESEGGQYDGRAAEKGPGGNGVESDAARGQTARQTVTCAGVSHESNVGTSQQSISQKDIQQILAESGSDGDSFDRIEKRLKAVHQKDPRYIENQLLLAHKWVSHDRITRSIKRNTGERN